MVLSFFKKLLSSKLITNWLNFLKYGLVLCIIPPLLNYAALNRETPVLGSHGLPYDVGMGQKLFLSCKGNGLPTGSYHYLTSHKMKNNYKDLKFK